MMPSPALRRAALASELLPVLTGLAVLAIIAFAGPGPERPRVAAAAEAAAPAPAPALALTNATLIDGTGRAPRPRMTVLVRGSRIADVFPAGRQPLPADAQVVDLTGRYLIPGLIDAHVHLGTRPRPAGMMQQILRAALLSGVTAVRDMGGSAAVVTPLARAALPDTAMSPRIYYAAVLSGPGRWFTGEFGAHAAGGLPLGESPLVRRVGTGTAVRQVVAEARAAGATGIKIYDAVDAALVRALVAEARRQGLRSWSHLAVQPTRPGELVAAGVEVVSHGDQFRAELTTTLPAGLGDSARRALRQDEYRRMSPDDPALAALLAQMKAAGTMLDPTLFVMLPLEPPADTTRAAMDQLLSAFRFAAAMTRRAARAGVPIVAGTDAIGGSSANLHAELQLLVDSAGLTPLQALTAATRNAALALGAQDSLGVVAPGMLADLVILRADPSRDIRNTQTVEAVVRAGHLHRRSAPLRPGPLAQPAPQPGARKENR